MLIDTHCHLNYPPLKDNYQSIIEKSQNTGVDRIICVGTTVESSETAIELAEKYDFIFATAGIHPSYVGKTGKGWQKEIERLADHPKCIAIGEIGIDHYWDHAPGDIQKKMFHEQIEMAESLDLPFIVHNRDADEDIESVLHIRQNYNGVLHCYCGDWTYAEKMLAMGMLISFTGIITYGKKSIKEVVRNIPLDKFMVETDSPFLTPSKLQSKEGTPPNEPAYLTYIVEKIAKLKQMEVEEIANASSQTAIKFFKLPA